MFVVLFRCSGIPKATPASVRRSRAMQRQTEVRSPNKQLRKHTLFSIIKWHCVSTFNMESIMNECQRGFEVITDDIEVAPVQSDTGGGMEWIHATCTVTFSEVLFNIFGKGEWQLKYEHVFSFNSGLRSFQLPVHCIA